MNSKNSRKTAKTRASRNIRKSMMTLAMIIVDFAQETPVKEINSINDLNVLNEGFYKIKNGYVYYLDTFNSAVPLYIKVLEPAYRNGILSIDNGGAITFSADFNSLVEKELAQNERVRGF